MTWLRLDDRFARHRKVSPLSDRAWRLHVTALLECAANLTDGLIEAALPGTWPSAPRGKALERDVAELVRAGLWVPTDGGWMIHDFLDWNPTGAEAKAKHDARSEAGRRGGKRSAEARAAGKQPPKQLLEQTPSNVEAKSNPVPVPVPTTTTTPGVRATLAERLVQPAVGTGAPPPRKDPLAERLPFSSWFPSSPMLAYCRAKGLTDADVDRALVEARDALTGRHDFEWFDVKVWRFLDVAIDRKSKPARSPRPGATHDDWPTDADVSLQHQIRAGQHGEDLRRKLELGQLDAALARRLIREARAEREERREARRDRGVLPLAASLPGRPE